jgi:hypothetical protein
MFINVFECLFSGNEGISQNVIQWFVGHWMVFLTYSLRFGIFDYM